MREQEKHVNDVDDEDQDDDAIVQTLTKQV